MPHLLSMRKNRKLLFLKPNGRSHARGGPPAIFDGKALHIPNADDYSALQMDFVSKKLKISVKIKIEKNEVNSIASAFSPILVHWAKKPKHTMIRNGSGSGKQVEAENNALSQPHRPMKVQPVAHLRLVA